MTHASTTASDAGKNACVELPLPPEDGSYHEAHLLLEAFEMFNQASSSLEGAFQQLQAHARKLTEELEAKNLELERSLREKEEVESFLKTVLESLPCGVVVLDAEGDVTLCNPVAAEVMKQSQTGGTKSRRRTKRRIRNPALRELMTRPGLACEQPRQEVEVAVLTGGALRILATTRTPLRGTSRSTGSSLHILRDITEVKSLEEQSKRAERLAAMGEMAVELAHEIRNPLGSIELFASLLERELGKESDAGRWAENIRVGSRSLDNIVSNMLHFAHPFAASFCGVDIHNLIGEVLKFTEPIMRQRSISVERDFAASRPVIRGDRELLKQVLLNLALNAMNAMPSDGSLRLATRNVAEMPGGAICDGLEILVSDTGVGIPQENLARIFDPYFTTNKNGTGLGLSVVHQIVERHSGFIQVTSRMQEGTTFALAFPSIPEGGVGEVR